MPAKKPHPLALAVGRRVAELRKAKGWTQTDLSRRCGFNQKRMSDIERGVTTAQLDTLARVAGALAVGPRNLLPEGGPAPSARAGAEAEKILRTLSRCRPGSRRTILRVVEALARYGG